MQDMRNTGSKVLTIDSNSVLPFYSATAQISAALLGIIVMFGVLILEIDKSKYRNSYMYLKTGLIGFTILYIFIVFFSIFGIILNDIGLYLNPIQNLPENLGSNIKGLLGISIIEFIILMIPVGLLYLYAIISDFLKMKY